MANIIGIFIWHTVGRLGATPSHIQLDPLIRIWLFQIPCYFKLKTILLFPWNFSFGNLLPAISNSHYFKLFFISSESLKLGFNCITAFLYSDWLYFIWHGIKENRSMFCSHAFMHLAKLVKQRNSILRKQCDNKSMSL